MRESIIVARFLSYNDGDVAYKWNLTFTENYLWIYKSSVLPTMILLLSSSKKRNLKHCVTRWKMFAYLWITKLGGPVRVSGLRPSDKLRPDTEPAQEWLFIDPASRRLALSRHSDEANMLARTLCLDPKRTEKWKKKYVNKKCFWKESW